MCMRECRTLLSTSIDCWHICPALKLEFVGSNTPMCNIAVSLTLRTWCTWNAVRDEAQVIVPVSEGWPPPWAWKIVEGVVRTWGVVSEDGLKRDWIEGGREERGDVDVMVEVWV